MKHILKGLALATLALMPLAAAAQKNISSAIDAFGANIGKYGIWNKVEEKDGGGAYCTTCMFKLPKKEEKKLDFIRKAFYEDVSEAYDVFIKKAGDKKKANMLVAYGDRLDKRLSLGWGAANYNADRNYLYMFVHSNDNADYRYVYGIEWQYKGKNVEGSVVKIYSRDPKKARAAYDSSVAILNGTYNINDSDVMKELSDDMKELGDDMKELKSLGKHTRIFGGKIKSGSDMIEQKSGKTIIKSGKQCLVINSDGSIDLDDGEGNTMSLDGKGNITGMEQEEASSDPIQQFGNLRAAYMNNLREGSTDNTTLLTGLANSILDLCKKKGQQMSSAERQLCTEGLKEMQDKTTDKFIKGIFGVAVNELNKYSQK